LPWLNLANESSPDVGHFSQWLSVLPVGAKIFEVGSGKAALLKYLSQNGFLCTATEITPERGARHAAEEGALIWHSTDGIHLAKFEPAESYDVVVSTGVIEHFHPDDLETHFKNARTILTSGGRYIFTTPHVSSGPHDLSRVFGADTAVCMHLREYSVLDLVGLLRDAGFENIRAVFPPSRLYRKVGVSWASKGYLFYLLFWDRFERMLKLTPARKRFLRKILKLALVPDNIWLSAKK
jgi:SAM-dependent methyltransferase